MASSESERPGPWYEGVTAAQWLVLVIASAGWIFDVYEGQLFAIFKTPALTELLKGSGLTDPRLLGQAVTWHSFLATALFLVGGAVGGLAFGVLGDRIGRVRVMSLTILVYSLFSALTFFVREAWEFDALRLLVALGTGGEWAVAAALVAETFPPRARAFGSGIFHASSVLGVAIAAVTGWFLTGPGAWRWGFLLGLAPALLVVWIMFSLREPEGWKESRRKAAGTERLGSLSELLGDPRWRPRALIGLGLAAVGLATYWGIFTWAPELVADVLGPSASADRKLKAASRAYLLMNLTGGLLGLLTFAPLANRFGRRFAFAFYHVGSLVFVPLTFLGARTEVQAVGLLPVMAFFVLGMHAGYAIYLPELFPTRLRATGASFCFNVARLVTAILLIVRGSQGAHLDLRQGVIVMTGLFVVGLVLLAFAPETAGRDLPE